MHVLQYPYDMCENPLALAEREKTKRVHFYDETRIYQTANYSEI